MAKNLVICCDGTGNEIGVTISNVLKLFRIAEKSDAQRLWYNAGVGTIGQQNPWTRLIQKVRGVFGLVTGLGLDDHVLGAYRFICENYEEGDRIYLFGFSRGAYTVRALAAFIHVMGLFRPDQMNVTGYAWSSFKGASAKDQSRATSDAPRSAAPAKMSALEEAWHFSRVIGGRPVTIEFIGVWDTVASVIVPRWEQLSFSLQTLRFTRTNPSVRTFRQAMAIDERRRMFRLNAWTEPQTFRPNPFRRDRDIAQDIKQVWFAGVHADIGGGYPEVESGISKYPLAWMIEEAVTAGLRVNRAMINHLVYGKERAGSTHRYTPPDFRAKLHRSLTIWWSALEIIPKLKKWREWAGRLSFLELYIPWAEPRLIPPGARVHQSAVDRKTAKIGYDPVNWPDEFLVEICESSPAPRRKARPKTSAVKSAGGILVEKGSVVNELSIEELAARFFAEAERVVRVKSLTFGDGADADLRHMSEDAARRVLADASGDLSTPHGLSLVQQSNAAFRGLAETMVKARTEIYDEVQLARNVVGEQTLQWALSKLCPLWPIC